VLRHHSSADTLGFYLDLHAELRVLYVVISYLYSTISSYSFL
jgi:hypothetical protein